MTARPYRPCAVIPVYNHGATVGRVLDALTRQGLACIIVDDGSDSTCAAQLDKLALDIPARLCRLSANGGKGHAVQAGLRLASTLGFTHALQIDADGQHALTDVSTFMAMSRENADAVVCGSPTYGSDAPLGRRCGRWLTRVWVWINTLSTDIPDAMCGFRIYPLNRVVPIIDAVRVGERMDFDIAILVRLHWARVQMVWLTTQVVYPRDGISHFKALRDNMLISRMHATLFFGMLMRLPDRVRQAIGSKPQ